MWENPDMRAIEVQTYLAKATDFLDGMKFFAEAQDQRYRYSSVLLAVHSAISYGDALSLGLGRISTASQNHRSRVAELRKLLVERQYKSLNGLNHFESLLRDKTDVAYTSKRITEKQASALIDHAQRFSIWANTVGSALKIEGWRDYEFV
jgi:hypothetical protein